MAGDGVHNQTTYFLFTATITLLNGKQT